MPNRAIDKGKVKSFIRSSVQIILKTFVNKSKSHFRFTVKYFSNLPSQMSTERHLANFDDHFS